jgi:hypothetical protein
MIEPETSGFDAKRSRGTNNKVHIAFAARQRCHENGMASRGCGVVCGFTVCQPPAAVDGAGLLFSR